MELTPIIKESFGQYAGAVLQSRALVDARDYLKPSARQIFYCLYTDKFIHAKPFKKTLKAIGSAMRMYIHGDSSCEGVIMRAGQPFAMRYPLIEVEGSYGNLMESGNWAASRYTASRLSPLAEYLFKDIEKDTINEWRDNYDDTEQYPAVLSTKGYCNIVNGTSGIGVGAASSIPAFNLREVNEALIKLLWNPDIPFEEIYCVPDFATGAILLNENDVKESLKNGTGKSCMLRSVIDYDTKEKCFIVTEIPYGVYTNTICSQLEDILNSDDNPGIDRFNDLTGSTPLLKIYLSKSARPEKVLKYLYKNTFLQYHYSINMTMLENGRFPRVFNWKEALQAYIDHEIIVYRQGFIFDLNKIKARLHIIAGLLKAINIIDEVIALIKGAADSKNASRALQLNFGFSEAQARAILDIKLSRLAHLEISKLEREQNELEIEKEKIEAILADETLLKKEIENGLREVANKFGDDRRTKILNLNSESDETIEKKSLMIQLTNQNNLLISEVSSLYTQRRGGVGNKFKLKDGEYVISSTDAETTGTLLFFTRNGNFYNYTINELEIGKCPVESLIPLQNKEQIYAITNFDPSREAQNILFFTKNGMMKKSLLNEYNIKRTTAVKAIDLNDGDEIVSVIFLNSEKVGILTALGNFLLIETEDVRAIGRVAKGVKSIKLNENDYVVAARVIPKNCTEILSISSLGYAKRTSRDEILVTGRHTKGAKLHKLKEDADKLVDFLPIIKEENVVIVSTSAQLKTDVKSFPLLSKGAQGTIGIKRNPGDRIIGFSKF